MRKILIVLSAALMIAALLCGCAKRAAEDVADTVSSAASDVKDDADKYGKTGDDDNGVIGDDASDAPPTTADMDKMIENGKIDDENDDDYDGDNIDDDADGETAAENNADNNADGGDQNAETMNDSNSEFI